MDAIREIKDSITFFSSPEIAELQKHAKMAAEELSTYYDSIKPYQAWLDSQRQITPPPFDNSSSSTHKKDVEDTDSQGETPAETEDR